MAIAEAVNRAPTLSQEELVKAIEDLTDEQLQEMGRRLIKSKEGLEEMLAMEETEKALHMEISCDLNETINLMMKEMHKLNIGAMNTVEPRLEEGRMAFVGRYWEKVKPRDTAYQIGEHVGEIKKPLVADGATLQTAQVAQEIAQHASKQVVQTAQLIQGSLGPLWKRTQGFINEKQSEITDVVARVQAQRAEAMPKHKVTDVVAQVQAQRAEAMAKHKVEQKAAERSTQARPQWGAEGFAGAAAVAIAAAAKKFSFAEWHSENAAAPSAAPAPKEAKASAAPKGAEVTDPPQAPAAATSLVPSAVSTVVEAATGTTATAVEPAAAVDAEEQMQSILLIEAHLKIDDGRVLVLQVKAADRCKEVAQRFVQENSLKVWFQDPLTTWLKKVEADAVKFPVKVEGDLLEIRKQFSKNKTGAKA